jgi:hypothetical protein
MARLSRTALTPRLFAALAAVVAADTNSASIATVPIRIVGTEAPVVMVRVEGKELPLQLDTGDASSLVIHPEILATLPSEPTGRTFKFFSMDGTFETPIVSIKYVEIGSLKFRDVDARKDAHDESFLLAKKSGVGAVGFIGTGLLDSGQIRLDYARKRLTISLPGETGQVRNLCRGKPIPFLLNKYGFATRVSTDIGELRLGWDTGAPAVLISASTAIAAHLSTDQEIIVSEKFVIAGMNYGPQRIEIWNNIPLPREIPGLIGHPFFARHIVCFDYPGSKLHIQRRP